MKRKLILPLLAYAVLGALAAVTLEGKLRIAIWILLGALAVKTWIASVSAPNGQGGVPPPGGFGS